MSTVDAVLVEKPIVQSCLDNDQLIERSKRLKQVVEERLKLCKAQMSFPLYPVFAVKPDFFTKVTCNTGYLGHLAQNWDQAMSNDANSAFCSPQPSKTIWDFHLEHGLPYELVGIGMQLDKCTTPVLPLSTENSVKKIQDTREVRPIEVVRNRLFFSGSCDVKQKSQVALSEPAAFQKPQQAIAVVRRIPIVCELTWKKLSLLVAKHFKQCKTPIFDSLLMDEQEISQKLVDILSLAENRDLLALWRQVRKELNSTTNPAYLDSMISALLGIVTARDWTPLFPRIYDTARAQDVEAIADPYVMPIWKQVIISQYVDNYYTGVLCMHHKLDAEMLLAHLFQICFGLDFAQSVLNFVHGDLNVRSAIGYVQVDDNVYLYFNWNGKYYRVPTYGKIIKVYGSEQQASIVIAGVKHSSAPLKLSKSVQTSSNNRPRPPKGTPSFLAFSGRPQASACEDGSDNDLNAEDDEEENTRDGCGCGPESSVSQNFNMDLLRLGATLRSVLRLKQVESEHEGVFDTLVALLRDWVSCFNDRERCRQSENENDLVGYRDHCLEEDNLGGHDDWKTFFDVPSHLDCPKALPAAQQPKFALFEIDSSQVPRDAMVYRQGSQPT